jgi:hypothetical protein
LRRHDSRWWDFRLWLCLFGLAAAGPAGAQGAKIPDGLRIGPWILAPSLEIGYELDDNLRRIDTSIQPAQETEKITEFAPALQASLPFRNSLLAFDYEASRLDYAVNQFSREIAQALGVQLAMSFSTGDTLTIGDEYRRDFADVGRISEGNELTFEGEPFNVNRWALKLDRNVADPSRQGYSMRVSRVDLNYVGDQPADFYDYRGFDNAFEYRQPLSDTRSLSVFYQTRRFNNYRNLFVNEDGEVERGEVGVPFRKELSDQIELGLSGTTAAGQPYRFLVGYGRLRYHGSESSAFSGITTAGSWLVRTSRRSSVTVTLLRRPFPSGQETYLVNNFLGVDLERRGRHASSLLASARTYFNHYGDFIPGCETQRREDLGYEVEAGAAWEVHRLVEFKLFSEHSKRDSNCEGYDYVGTRVRTALAFGW